MRTINLGGATIGALRLRVRPPDWGSAALLYLVLAAALFWPSLVSGAVPLPLMNAYLQGDPVWSALRPESATGGANRLQGDVTGFYYPYAEFSIERLRTGEFPLWNPYTFGGMPYFAANQAALLYPINLLTFWLGPHAYWAASAILRLVVAGLGTCLLARRLGTSQLGALLSGGAYMLADFNVVWLHFAIHNVAALLPLALWLIHRIVCERSQEGGAKEIRTQGGKEDPSSVTRHSPLVARHSSLATRRSSLVARRAPLVAHRRSLLGLAGIVAAQMLGGHPEMSLFFLVTCVVFAAAFAVRVGRHPGANRPARSVVGGLWSVAGGRATLVALALGLALSAVQWVPTLTMIRHSYTLEERGFAAGQGAEEGDDYAPLGGLRRAGWDNLRHWLLLVAPQLWGTPRGEEIRNWLRDATNYNEMTPYVGLATLPLALAGALRGRNRRAAWLFGGALLLSLLLFYPLPGLRLLGYLPGLEVAHGFRFGMGVALAAALLAGMGLDALRPEPAARSQETIARSQAPGAARRSSLVARHSAVALAALALALLSLAVAYDLWGGARVTWALGFDPTGAERSQIASVYHWDNWRVLLPGAAGLLVALALLAGAARPQLLRRSLPAVVAIVLAEQALYGYGFNGFTAPAAVYPETRAIGYLRQMGGNGRALNLDGALWANTAMVHGIQVTSGMDDLLPADQGRFLKRGISAIVARVDRHVVLDWGQRLMDVMNVRYILASRQIEAGPGAAQPQLVLRDGNLLVYRNAGAVPRAYATGGVVVSDQPEDAVFAPGFDPRRQVVLDRAPPGLAPTEHDPIAPVPILSYGAGRVELAPILARPSLVVLADAYDPDWRVTVDGRPAELLRANGMFRGVAVPAGSHSVVFEYRPRAVLWGGLVSLVALGAFVALAGARARTPRRRPNVER